MKIYYNCYNWQLTNFKLIIELKLSISFKVYIKFCRKNAS